ncbi:hypothetical protein [Labedaea rhizosphaerae]|uniref:Uncharacterized protein n=1 Tax=Labedaea rhizosphaerae TaxID=598644 RepID=A0A4R6SI63_LABRH|nr:hypothetical protein [Labedaea rhizosphaerae]TDQ01280.1 hypothetical protein EV186_1021148 [Labedaea rhizosphaerae]
MTRPTWRDRWRREWNRRDRAENWFIALCLATILMFLLLLIFGAIPALELLS